MSTEEKDKSAPAADAAPAKPAAPATAGAHILASMGDNVFQRSLRSRWRSTTRRLWPK